MISVLFYNVIRHLAMGNRKINCLEEATYLEALGQNNIPTLSVMYIRKSPLVVSPCIFNEVDNFTINFVAAPPVE